jgi:DNA-binding NarL/FixJ family response regulator
MTDALRLIVVDDHPMYRSEPRAVLDDDPAVSVLAEAATERTPSEKHWTCSPTSSSWT